MIDPSLEEIASIEKAGEIAGEYLDTIPETDMAKWDEATYFTFIEVVVTAYQDAMYLKTGIIER